MSLKLNSKVFGVDVRIKVSGETGTITGFAQHSRGKQKQFYVEYKAADGRATEGWFHEDQLEVRA